MRTKRELAAQIAALRSTLAYVADPPPDASDADVRKVATRMLELWPEPAPTPSTVPPLRPSLPPCMRLWWRAHTMSGGDDCPCPSVGPPADVALRRYRGLAGR